MKKLVLVSVDTEESGHPPLGIGYIASYLKKYLNFNNISIVDKKYDIFKMIKKHNPEIVGISSVTKEFGKTIELSNRIRNELNIPVILGGCHITSAPYTLPKSAIGVIGEGEQTVFELMKLFNKHGEFSNNELKKIDGLVFWNKNKLIATQPRKLIKSLDTIPFPARDLFNMNYYLSPRKSVATKKVSRGTHMMTSRGCPFRCVFCAASRIWNNTIRYNSPEYVVNEINELINKYNVNGISFFDDFFASNINRLKKIVESVKKEGIDIDFRCSTRTDFINEESVKLLKKMNIVSVSLGFESGSERILSYLKNNTVTVKHNKMAINLLKKYGIDVHGYFIFGTPTETKEDMVKTMKFIEEHPIDSVSLGIVTSYPGTELWEYAKHKGLVSDNMDWDILYHKPDTNNFIFLNEDEMTKEEFLNIFNSFLRKTESMRYRIKFKSMDLFSFDVLKRAFFHPRRYWKYFYYSVIKR